MLPDKSQVIPIQVHGLLLLELRGGRSLQEERPDGVGMSRLSFHWRSASTSCPCLDFEGEVTRAETQEKEVKTKMTCMSESKNEDS